MKKSPRHRRTDSQRANDLIYIQSLISSDNSISHEEITELVNLRATDIYGDRAYSLSREQITYDIREIKKEIKRDALDDIAANVSFMLDIYKGKLQEALYMYEKSKGKIIESRTVEGFSLSKKESSLLKDNERLFLNVISDKLKKVKVTRAEQTDSHSIQWLNAVINITKQMRDLLSMDAPKQVIEKKGKESSILEQARQGVITINETGTTVNGNLTIDKPNKRIEGKIKDADDNI